MKINSVKIFPYRDAESNLKATATIVVNNALILQSVRIAADSANPGQLHVVYPTRLLADGGRRLVFFPTEAGKEKFRTAVLEAYERYLADPSEASIILDDDPTYCPFVVTNSTIYPHLGVDVPAKAKVNIELDGELHLKNMVLQNRLDGSLTLRMPQRDLSNGQRMDIYHPLTTESRIGLTEAVMPCYEEALRQARKEQATRMARR